MVHAMNGNFDMKIALGIVEDEHETRAAVVLELGGKRFESVGLARRNPADPNVPVVGEELATSRALADLSHELLHAAIKRIEQFEG
jgi:hypothetical protein